MTKTLSRFLIPLLVAPLVAAKPAPETQVSKATLSPEKHLMAKLNETLKAPVFVKQLGKSDLFVVAVGEDVLFTDSKGEYLIKGDILHLQTMSVISEIEKEEFRALRRKTQVAESSVLSGLPEFLSYSRLKQLSSLRAIDSASGSAMLSRPSTKPREEGVGQTKPPVLPRIQALSVDGYNQDRINREQSCIDRMKDAGDDLNGLYRTMRGMTPEDQKYCGGVLTSMMMPHVDPSKLVSYDVPDSKGDVTIISDFSCSLCVREHNGIKALNDNGYSVHIYPYGRGSYFEIAEGTDGVKRMTDKISVLGQNYAALSCAVGAEKKRLLDSLMSNGDLYSVKALPEGESITSFSSDCAKTALRDKAYGDMFTGINTPLHYFDDGSTHLGYLTVPELLAKLKK